MPLNPAPDPAGDAEPQLLAALARRYAGGEFSARFAASDLDPALWSAAGVARPDPAAAGRWLRSQKGVAAGYALANRKNRDGVALWRVRPAEPRLPPPAIPRDPASSPPSEAVPPAPLSSPASRPWWSIAAAPAPAAGGAAEGRRGARWWEGAGEVAP